MQDLLGKAFALSGYDYDDEESPPMSDVYCVSKEIRQRGNKQFLVDVGKHITAGLAAKGSGQIKVAGDFTVEHLARSEFENFREFLGITEEAYLSSFSEVTGGATSDGGRSGSLYWFSRDSKYILKSSSSGDIDKLMDMMPRYVAHFHAARQAGRPCFLLRLFGAYRFRVGKEVLGLICMNDVWDGRKPSRLYDLKGTTHHRYVEEKPGVVLKDLNFETYMVVDKVNGKLIHEAFSADSAFLEKENSIDYSLLLGIDDDSIINTPDMKQPSARDVQAAVYQGHEVAEEYESESSMCGCGSTPDVDDGVQEQEAEATPCKIRMGIIDFLGQWSTKKRAERWKKNLTGACCHEHSSMPADYYRDRWVQFMEDKFVYEKDGDDGGS